MTDLTLTKTARLQERIQRRSLRRHAGEIEAQVNAVRGPDTNKRSRARRPSRRHCYADVERLRERIVACRRLEEIGDRLRELSGSVRVEIDDATLAYLREQEVI
jgi:hypothetical protein